VEIIVSNKGEVKNAVVRASLIEFRVDQKKKKIMKGLFYYSSLFPSLTF
jgi:hypothetical protein